MEIHNKMNEFLGIFIYFAIATGLASLLAGLSYIFSTQRPDAEKISAYECGFDPFDDSRGQFDVQFYLVAILFIIFDLETAFLFLNYSDLSSCWASEEQGRFVG